MSQKPENRMIFFALNIAGPLCRPSEGVGTLLARTSAAANENQTSEAIDGVLIEEWLESL
jgi:hypothetical protein